MFGRRDLNRVLRAAVGREHYTSLLNTFRWSRQPFTHLQQYLLKRPAEPYHPELRTPTGVVRPALHSIDDVLTVHEIFFRLDYRVSDDVAAVIDVGSNIGLSALYFLSRNDSCRVWVHEPDTRNADLLEANLAAYRDRYVLDRRAVADRRGMVAFGIEPTGRYGGIGLSYADSIEVECIHIDDVVRQVLDETGRVDVLKLDIEGAEIPTAQALDPELARHIDRIYLEGQPTFRVREDFEQRQRGSICELINPRRPSG